MTKRREFVKFFIDNAPKNDGIRLVVVQRRPYTYVRVVYEHIGGFLYVGHGFSKVMRPDKWDNRKGIELAFVKGCGDLVDTMLRQYPEYDLDKIGEYLHEAFPPPNPSDDAPHERDYTAADLAYDTVLERNTYSSEGPYA